MKEPEELAGSGKLLELETRLATCLAQLAEQQARVARLEEQLSRASVPAVEGGIFWLPVSEAALRIGCSVKTLGKWRRKGLIPRRCWAKNTCRHFTYYEPWIEAARNCDLPTAFNLFKLTVK